MARPRGFGWVAGVLAWLALTACSRLCDASYDRELEAFALGIEAQVGNAALAREVERGLGAARADPDGVRARIRTRLDARGVAPLRVPGLLYESNPETGADLSALERWLGAPVPLAPTGERDSVEANAAVVAEVLRANAAAGRRSLVVSASKGSADVRAALEGEPELGRLTPFWIDLVGVLEGTPLLDPGAATLADVESWLPAETARSMSRAVRRAAAAPERFPSETRAVHVAAFPRAGEVSERARESFEWLRVLGLNDGYVLLDAYAGAPGRVLVVRGTDHYLRGAVDLEARFLALLLALLEEGGAERPGARDSRAPSAQELRDLVQAPHARAVARAREALGVHQHGQEARRARPEDVIAHRVSHVEAARGIEVHHAQGEVEDRGVGLLHADAVRVDHHLHLDAGAGTHLADGELAQARLDGAFRVAHHAEPHAASRELPQGGDGALDGPPPQLLRRRERPEERPDGGLQARVRDLERAGVGLEVAAPLAGAGRVRVVATDPRVVRAIEAGGIHPEFEGGQRPQDALVGGEHEDAAGVEEDRSDVRVRHVGLGYH